MVDPELLAEQGLIRPLKKKVISDAILLLILSLSLSLSLSVSL